MQQSRWSVIFSWKLLDKYCLSVVALISLFTTIFIYYSYGKVLSVETLTVIWNARNNPSTVLEFFLYPFVFFKQGELLYLVLINLSLTLGFVYFAELLGIGRRTLFFVFLLFNYSLEYNDIRLEIDAEQVFTLLWLLANIAFVRNFEKRPDLAVIYWCIFISFGVLFSSLALIWAVFFPLFFLFLFRKPWQKFYSIKWSKITKIILTYYILLLLLMLFIPHCRNNIVFIFQQIVTNFNNSSLEMSLFFNNTGAMSPDFANIVLIALAIVLLNLAYISGVLVLFTIWLSLSLKMTSVVSSKKRMFLYLNLVFFVFSAGIYLLYNSHLPSETAFISAFLILLLLYSSNACYYISSRLVNNDIKPERLMIFIWLFVAYAFASMIKFGPSDGYLKQAGQWAKNHNYTVFSDNKTALFYAGKSPDIISENYISLLEFNAKQEYHNPVYIFNKNRHRELTNELDNFEIIQEFSNKHGNTAYIIRIK
ncbi:MAG: hypothetical protein J6M05_00235 [Cardiobacteriaceae bacterium]|nr:hypothetical protein [Cardiobacteriaceae bacterium]